MLQQQKALMPHQVFSRIQNLFHKKQIRSEESLLLSTNLYYSTITFTIVTAKRLKDKNNQMETFNFSCFFVSLESKICSDKSNEFFVSISRIADCESWKFDILLLLQVLNFRDLTIRIDFHAEFDLKSKTTRT